MATTISKTKMRGRKYDQAATGEERRKSIRIVSGSRAKGGWGAPITSIRENDETGTSNDYNYMTKVDSLPDKIREPAMQSAAAQYATLIGYEDIILNLLKEEEEGAGYSMKVDDLPRNPTPPPNLMDDYSVDKAVLERGSATWQSRVLPPLTKIRTKSISRQDSATVSTQNRSEMPRRSYSRISFAPGTHASHAREDQMSRSRKFSILSEMQNNGAESEVRLPVLPIHKHRQMVSYQLENAMDIIDKIIASRNNGRLVTSKRHTMRNIPDPMQAYCAWADVWPNLFTYARRERQNYAASQSDYRLTQTQTQMSSVWFSE